MRTYKIACSLVLTCTLSFGYTARAAIYAMDNLHTVPSIYNASTYFELTPFSQIAAHDIDSGIWNFTPSNNHIMFSSFADDTFTYSLNFDLTPAATGQATSSFIVGDRGIVISTFKTRDIGLIGLNDIYFANQFTQGESNRTTDRYPPVTTPVPEPETYAMILAGLGLILFTARRRMENI